MAPLNEHRTEDLTYLSRHIPISITVHDTLSKEPVYLVDKNPKRLIKRFIEVLTEKQEAMVADALKQHPYLQIFKCFQTRCKNNGGNALINGLIGFNSGKYDLKIYEPWYIAYLATSGSKRETTK